jgi:pimeloyl-ACP methyl ester carboxylesterase
MRARHEDADRMVAEGTEFFIDRMRPSWLSAATLTDRPELVREVDAMARQVPPATAAATLRGLAARRDERATLGEIAVRALVLCGADDPITPPDGMEAMAAAIPGARFSRVPGGHFSPLEYPVEVNTELAAFISSRP